MMAVRSVFRKPEIGVTRLPIFLGVPSEAPRIWAFPEPSYTHPIAHFVILFTVPTLALPRSRLTDIRLDGLQPSK
jgi:hypothetical protein